MLSKIDVNGSNTHELYKFLKDNEVFRKGNEPICKEGIVENIPWNFAKFLVNRNGEVTNYYGPKVNPEELRDQIKILLAWNCFKEHK